LRQLRVKKTRRAATTNSQGIDHIASHNRCFGYIDPTANTTIFIAKIKAADSEPYFIIDMRR
jgi:hypothetical protein